MDLYLLYSVTL